MYSFDLIYVQTWSRPYIYSFDLIYVQACSRPYICTVLTLYMCRHGVDLIYAVFDLIYVQVDLIYLTLDLIYQILTIYLKTDFCPIWRVIQMTQKQRLYLHDLLFILYAN